MRKFPATKLQLRGLYDRLKSKELNEADVLRDEKEKRMRKECAVTGGGEATLQNLEEDVDENENDTNVMLDLNTSEVDAQNDIRDFEPIE